MTGRLAVAAVAGLMLCVSAAHAAGAKAPKTATKTQADTTPYSLVAIRNLEGKVSFEAIASSEVVVKEASLETSYQAALAQAKSDKTVATPTKPALIVLKADIVGKKEADALLAKLTAALNPAPRAEKPATEGGAAKPAKSSKKGADAPPHTEEKCEEEQ